MTVHQSPALSRPACDLRIAPDCSGWQSTLYRISLSDGSTVRTCWRCCKVAVRLAAEAQADAEQLRQERAAKRDDRPALAVGQVWDGNVQDGGRRALFRVLKLRLGRVVYECPLGQRLDGWCARGEMPECDFRLYAWTLLSADVVEALGG